LKEERAKVEKQNQNKESSPLLSFPIEIQERERL